MKKTTKKKTTKTTKKVANKKIPKKTRITKKKETKITFKEAFNYPFNRPKGLLNILWILLPIIGWLALGGYSARIIQEFTKGKFKQLPQLHFSKDFKTGLYLLIKALPFIIIYLTAFSWLISINKNFEIIEILVELFILPMLFIHFINKQTAMSLFEFSILKNVLNNFTDYVTTLIKSIALAILFIIMFIILIGIPAHAFTQYLYLTDFYRRNIQK